MKAVVAAAGPLGVAVAEELVRACWTIHALHYDAAGPEAPSYEKFQKQVSFPLRPVPRDGWPGLWDSLPWDAETMLFLIGCPEPPARGPRGRGVNIYALQPGLLPSQAGPDAHLWALYRGEGRTGVTLYRRGEKPYSGDLLFQEACPIADTDDAGTVEKALKDLAVEMVRRFWEVSTRAQLRPRKTFISGPANPPWAGGVVPWKEPTARVHNFVRASTHPYPGAHTYLKKRKLTIWKTSPLSPKGEIKTWRAGEIYSFDPFRVWTGDGLIRLDRVQWEGEEEMPGTDFARTRGIEPGLFLEDQPGP